MTVNVLPLEQYLRGVVPSEMRAATWPQHALRAQAVASRTYAVWRRAHALDRAYDICDTALCQVYGGATAEYPTSDKAVRATAREILTFRGSPAFAEYSASNGGYTVSGGRPYLPAKKDPYEGMSSDYYGWTVTIAASELEDFYNLENLTQIRIAARDGNGRWGGRVTRLEVTTEGGENRTDVLSERHSFHQRASGFKASPLHDHRRQRRLTTYPRRMRSLLVSACALAAIAATFALAPPAHAADAWDVPRHAEITIKGTGTGTAAGCRSTAPRAPRARASASGRSPSSTTPAPPGAGRAAGSRCCSPPTRPTT